MVTTYAACRECGMRFAGCDAGEGSCCELCYHARGGIRLTVTDEATGDTESCVIGDGPAGYVVTTGPGCYVAHEVRHANGTVQLTIKPTA